MLLAGLTLHANRTRKGYAPEKEQPLAHTGLLGFADLASV
jgi:hypothetical protein